jgi:hypothetical protein
MRAAAVVIAVRALLSLLNMTIPLLAAWGDCCFWGLAAVRERQASLAPNVMNGLGSGRTPTSIFDAMFPFIK